MLAVIDCGTTNTRVYLVDASGTIRGQSAGKVGVRDVAVAGTNLVLKQGLRRIFAEALATAGASANAVKFAVASGMITSEVGLVELEHNAAPCGLPELAAGAAVSRDEAVTALPVPVLFIRGVKNRPGVDAALSELRSLDFMRGEETQMMGLLALRRPRLPATVIMLGSHTKMIALDAQGRIRGSMTSISGELYESLTTTLIAKSLRPAADEPSARYNRQEVLTAAASSVRQAGFLRTMLMPRFMQVLMRTNVEERRLFVGAAIAAADLQVCQELRQQVQTEAADCILIGQRERCEIYRDLLAERSSGGPSLEIIDGERETAAFTVAGATAVARLAAASGKI